MGKRNASHLVACPFEQAMDVLNGKWKGMLVFRLKEQSLKFTELKNLLPGISNRMLSRVISELEDEGLLLKNCDNTDTKSHAYQLTQIAKDLLPGLQMIRDWGLSYQDLLRGNSA